MNIKVDTKNIYEDFQSHLIQSDNERILFSSAFGTGKSTFLTEYFNGQPEYNVFKIYPVSYSVVNNEDIFELIKYDVLFQLFERSEEGQLDLINEDYSQILAFQFKFLRQAEYSPILFKLLELADKTGKYSVIEKVIAETRRQYESFKSTHKDEQEEIYDFLFQQYSKKGSPKENDLISQLIRDLLSRLKTPDKIVQADDGTKVEKVSNVDDNEQTAESDLEVENVLIIDDLDRLDPEHIFRLFNVFSVNFGSNEIENKFGFDKIIFVCDLENIRKIYEHRYGKGVDFEGYIDKFYSTNPFKFNTNQLLSNYITDLLQGFNLPSSVIDFTDRRNLDYHTTYILLRCIINNLIVNKKLNLRKLLNSRFFSISTRPFAFNRHERHNPMQFPILMIFQILEGLFDSFEVLEETIKEMSKTYNKKTFGRLNSMASEDDIVFQIVMDTTIPFIIDRDQLDPQVANLRSTDNLDLSLKVEEIGLLINFTVSQNFGRSREIQFTFRDFSDQSGNKGVEVNPYDILAIAYRRCKNLDIF